MSMTKKPQRSGVSQVEYLQLRLWNETLSPQMSITTKGTAPTASTEVAA